MRLSHFCFLVAALTALCGMSLGIYMGLANDHRLGPVHAHLNLLGFVTTFLFGLYYRSAPDAQGRLAATQVTASILGYVAMCGGLAGMFLIDPAAFLPLAVTGSVLALAGMALFVVVVTRERGKAWRSASVVPAE